MARGTKSDTRRSPKDNLVVRSAFEGGFEKSDRAQMTIPHVDRRAYRCVGPSPLGGFWSAAASAVTQGELRWPSKRFPHRILDPAGL